MRATPTANPITNPTHTPSPPWPEQVRAPAARLGLIRCDIERQRRRTRRAAIEHADRHLRSFLDNTTTPILAIIAPSGAGKTTALRRAARIAELRDDPIIHPRIPSIRAATRDPRTTPSHALARLRPDWTTDQSLRHLARFGLADAGAITTPTRRLSAGQRARLTIALLIAAATAHIDPKRRPLIIIDEFGATLDDLTAIPIARALAHAAERHTLRIALATHRPRILPHLRPCTILELNHAGIPRTIPQNSAPTDPPPNLTITHATTRDYHALAHLHYRHAHPANIAAIFKTTITDPHPIDQHDEPHLAAVLVIAHPTLNAAWRSLAWPNRYTTRDRKLNAQRINDELRCIARVIVDPRFRTLNLATSLVRHYLANPITPHTEALAAMGAVSPFFERAGMTPYHLTPNAHNARLLDLLAHAGITTDWLAEPRHAWQQLTTRIDPQLALRELNRWAQHTPSARPHPGPQRWLIACRSLLAHPIAYAHAIEP
ncbi:MAG: hypothetical protein ACTS3F_00365 [Phycisphaerales bacterium]